MIRPCRRYPISVSANLQTAVTVSPSVLNLGRLRPGEVVKKTVLVRSSQPFKLTELQPSQAELSATPDPDGARPMHTVNLTFKAPAASGPYHAICEIATDVKDEPAAEALRLRHDHPLIRRFLTPACSGNPDPARLPFTQKSPFA